MIIIVTLYFDTNVFVDESTENRLNKTRLAAYKRQPFDRDEIVQFRKLCYIPREAGYRVSVLRRRAFCLFRFARKRL